MRKSKVITGLLVLCVLFALAPACGINAKKSKSAKLETKKLSVTVEQGKKYSYSKFVGDMKTVYSLAELDKKLKKNKVSWSGKGLKIAPKSFTAKKQGTYKLTAKTNKVKYIFTLSVTTSVLEPVELSEVAKIAIRSGSTGQQKEVTDQAVIGQIVQKLNAANYQFDFSGSLKQPVGWMYNLEFYNAAGICIRKVVPKGNSLTEGETLWYTDSTAGAELLTYIGDVFSK